MLYLGLDLSLRGTGLCLLDSSDDPVFLKLIKTKLRDTKRLVYIRDQIAEVLFDRDIYAALEGYAYGALGRVFEIGELGGVVKTLLQENLDPEVIIVAPNAVKKWVSGSGRGGKVPVGVALYREFGLEFSDDNTADAFALACIAKQYHGQLSPDRERAYRRDVIQVIQKAHV